jgi:glycosyltransferase involved in cell wall biosynthesis
MAELEISVIIPAWNKAYELELVLEALACQARPCPAFEVIVVDDGSEPPLEGRVAVPGSLDLKWCRQPRLANRALLRSTGVGMAGGRLLLFMDGDMLAENGLVASHAAAVTGPEIVSLGIRKCMQEIDKAYLTPEVVRERFDLLRQMPAEYDERTMALNHGFARSERLFGHWNLLYSHNFCLYRETYLKSGGFDPDFGKNWGAEDIELGYRLVKMGCKLRFTRRALAYHVHHGTDVRRNVLSLRRNLDLFFAKHPEWMVEIHRREYQMWHNEHAALCDKILAGAHRAEQGKLAPRALAAAGVRGRVLLNGIPRDPGLDSDPAPLYLVQLPLGRMPAADEMNLLGLSLPFPDGHFDAYVLSAGYQAMHEELYQLILKEALRVGKAVYTFDPADGFLRKAGRDRLGSPARKVLFTLSNNHFLTSSRETYYPLALALEKNGAKVGLQFAYDPGNEIDRYGGYYGVSSPEKIRALERMFDHDLNLVGDEVRAIIEPDVARWTNRSVGNRIVWDELGYENQEHEFNLECLPKFDQVWLRRESDRGRLHTDGKPVEVVPIGADLGKYAGRPIAPGGSGVFTFFWCVRGLGHVADPAVLVRAFRRAFPDSRKVRLKMVGRPESFPALPTNEYANRNMDALYRDYFVRMAALEGLYFRSVKDECASDPRIEWLPGDMSETEVAKLFLESDALVDTDSSLRLSPLVLESAALGRRPILGDTGKYAGYLSREDCLPVRCRRAWAGNIGPLPELPDAGARHPYRNFLVSRMDVEDLAAVLAEAAARPDSIRLDAGRARAFGEAFDWNAIAGRILARSY